jgi:hypothetical protein
MTKNRHIFIVSFELVFFLVFWGGFCYKEMKAPSYDAYSIQRFLPALTYFYFPSIVAECFVNQSTGINKTEETRTKSTLKKKQEIKRDNDLSAAQCVCFSKANKNNNWERLLVLAVE